MRNNYNSFGYWLIVLGVMLLVSWALSGCVTQKRCQAKFPPQVEVKEVHTKEIIRKDSILAGATVTNTIFRDTIISMEVNKWRVIRDTSGIAELRYYKDAYGNLNAQCIANSRMIEKLREIEEKTAYNKEVRVKVEKEMPFWGWLLIILLVVLYLKRFIPFL